jgi:hypothetical protein
MDLAEDLATREPEDASDFTSSGLRIHDNYVTDRPRPYAIRSGDGGIAEYR